MFLYLYILPVFSWKVWCSSTRKYREMYCSLSETQLSSCFSSWWSELQCSQNVGINDKSKHGDNP